MTFAFIAPNLLPEVCTPHHESLSHPSSTPANRIAEAFGTKDPQIARYDILAEDFATRESRHGLGLGVPGASSGRIWHGRRSRPR